MYLEHHPEAANYRKKTLPFYSELLEIYDGNCAPGLYASNSDSTSAVTSSTSTTNCAPSLKEQKLIWIRLPMIESPTRGP